MANTGLVDEMDGLTVHEEPGNSFPTMIVAFAGWPDASESATTAVRFMVRKLSAKPESTEGHRWTA